MRPKNEKFLRWPQPAYPVVSTSQRRRDAARKEPPMATSEQKHFGTPDESREFELGKLDLINIGDGTVGRLTLQPGWRWSEHVKPVANTESCEAPHFQYHLAGTLHVQMSDGTEFDAMPGDVTALPSGHDAWVVGTE